MRTRLSATVRGWARRGRPAGRGAVSVPASPGWHAALRGARWDESALALHGWCYVEGVDTADREVAVHVSLRSRRAGTAPVPVRTVRDDEVNHVADDDTCDYSGGAFYAEIPHAALTGLAPWTVELLLTVDGARWSGPFTTVLRRGSAGVLWRKALGGGEQVTPTWNSEHGLVLQRARRAVTTTGVTLQPDGIRVPLQVNGRPLAGVRLDRADGQTLAGWVDAGPDGMVARLPLPPTASGDWVLHAIGDDGRQLGIHHKEDVVDLASPVAGVELRTGPSGVLRVSTDPVLAVEDVTVLDTSPPALRVEGTLPTRGGSRLSIAADGPRESTVPTEGEAAGGRFSLDLTLAYREPWMGGTLPLPVGTYAVRGMIDGVPARVRVSRSVLERCEGWCRLNDVMVRVERSPHDALELRLAPPRSHEEWSAYGRRRSDEADRTRTYAPRDLVLLESFLGKHAACNPRAIRDMLAERHPGLQRTWSVFEASVPVPEGDDKVVIGTDAWRAARGSARWLVTNDWFRRYEGRSHQTLLQTWHGTPFKCLALDRRDRRGDLAFQREVADQSSRWDLLVSQSPYMTDALRNAYGYEGEVLEVGYPRNDVLVRDGTSVRRREVVRAMLGIDPSATVVLYASTWRDDPERRMVRTLDLETLARDADVVVLVRAHAETIRHDRRAEGARVLDVTLYPEVSELFLVADALITDYSSVMFDFAVTGRPIIFDASDMESYLGAGRGAYFDLAQLAPGPLTRGTDDVGSWLQNLPELQRRYADAYDAWVSRFVPYDDGGATARVVDAVWR